MTKPARILLADDHALMLTGIRTLLEKNYDVVGQVTDGRALVEEAVRLRPDLIVLDIAMPLLNGIDAARQIKKAWPQSKFLFLTMHATPVYLREAVDAGASGYLLKSAAAEELRTAVQRVLKGQVCVSPSFSPEIIASLRSTSGRRSGTLIGLTERQREVMQLIAEGRGNKEIAAVLNISVKTVEFHRGRIMHKLGVHSVVDLIRRAVTGGLVAE